MPKEPVARGVVLAAAVDHTDAVAALRKEALSILRALDAPGREAQAAGVEDDYVVLVLGGEGDGAAPAWPDLKDRAATVIAVGEDAPLVRAAIARARKRLRERGATLGARELLLRPAAFGYLGLESDGLRERLEILLRTLVLDAERLRLRREGWEEPDA